jgi:hypothetical protein
LYFLSLTSRYRSALETSRRIYHDTLERRFIRRLPSIVELTSVDEVEKLGRSVVAIREIEGGTLLGIYPGQRLRISEFVEKGEFVSNSLRYAYYLSEDLIIDPTDLFGYLPNKPRSRLALINEPPPGLRANIVSLSSSNHIWYACLRTIKEGEQLFTSYGPNYNRNYPTDFQKTNGLMYCDEKDYQQLRAIAHNYPWLKDSAEQLQQEMELFSLSSIS